MLRRTTGKPLWTQTASGRVVTVAEPVMLALALLSVPVLVIEVSTTNEPWRTIASVANWVIWAGFAAELAFVLAVAPRRLQALKAHWLDVLIVALTAPVVATVLSGLRLLRLVRFLRLLRIGLFGVRAVQAARVLTTRQGFRFVALATILIVVVSGFAVAALDQDEFPNVWLGMWWAITTVTTVGYGDVAPTTVGGRILAGCLMVIGIGFLSVLTAAIASWFVRVDTTEEREEIADEQQTLHEIYDRLSRLEARGTIDEVALAVRRIEAQLHALTKSSPRSEAE